VYEGEWAEGKKHGKGTITYASGEVEVGCYEFVVIDSYVIPLIFPD